MEYNTINTAPAILRMREVTRVTGLSRASIYRMVKAGLFPGSVPLGVAAVGWMRSDVERWIGERVSMRDNARAA
jgi:prophage regulatory protein